MQSTSNPTFPHRVQLFSFFPLLPSPPLPSSAREGEEIKRKGKKKKSHPKSEGEQSVSPPHRLFPGHLATLLSPPLPLVRTIERNQLTQTRNNSIHSNLVRVLSFDHLSSNTTTRLSRASPHKLLILHIFISVVLHYYKKPRRRPRHRPLLDHVCVWVLEVCGGGGRR